LLTEYDLLLLSRLGIRAMEAAQLQIDDIDWSTGCILIWASKNHRERNLPLSEDVGQALVDYLRDGRPQLVTTPYRIPFSFPRWEPESLPAMPATNFCRRAIKGMVPPWCGCSGAHPKPFGVSRSSQAAGNLLVFDRDAGIAYSSGREIPALC
jgi:integrase